ncbi:hypothetical protein [Actinoalloteichus caeruleus]|uniref:hypothetical protein n=1 Tax=Actinoalloteichus cyanogriseus TaxID=2893586 RepID=UPI0004198013|nr:hypothetical protein [Actinoalloteichus caeruleus]
MSGTHRLPRPITNSTEDTDVLGLRVVPPSTRGGVANRGWRGFSGAVAAGLVVLALVVLGLQVLALHRGYPGPGYGFVALHLGASVVAVGLQAYADRSARSARWWAPVLVVLVAGWLLWTGWWH